MILRQKDTLPKNSKPKIERERLVSQLSIFRGELPGLQVQRLRTGDPTGAYKKHKLLVELRELSFEMLFKHLGVLFHVCFVCNFSNCWSSIFGQLVFVCIFRIGEESSNLIESCKSIQMVG